MDVGAHYKLANEEILLAVQIEDIEAVANIDDILAVEGIDAAFIGPYDLSLYGDNWRLRASEFVAARNEILASCKRNGVTPGIHVVQPNAKQVIDRISDGFHLLAYSLDITMVLNACLDGLNEIRTALPKK